MEGKFAASREYLRLALCSMGAAVVILGVGYWPTMQLAGSAGVTAMVAGVAIALAAALAGLLPPLLADHADPRKRASGMFLGIVVRFGAVVVLTFAVALANVLPRTPLLLWIATAYMGLMIVDNVALVRLARSAAGQNSAGAQGAAQC